MFEQAFDALDPRLVALGRFAQQQPAVLLGEADRLGVPGEAAVRRQRDRRRAGIDPGDTRIARQDPDARQREVRGRFRWARAEPVLDFLGQRLEFSDRRGAG
ncbi:MAG: hypothetical protein JWN59_1722 [Sphingomonas bacterium]|nr:hypothetical protein [Sphingomonas bacterium]